MSAAPFGGRWTAPVTALFGAFTLAWVAHAVVDYGAKILGGVVSNSVTATAKSSDAAAPSAAPAIASPPPPGVVQSGGPPLSLTPPPAKTPVSRPKSGGEHVGRVTRATAKPAGRSPPAVATLPSADTSSGVAAQSAPSGVSKAPDAYPAQSAVQQLTPSSKPELKIPPAPDIVIAPKPYSSSPKKD